MKRADTQYQLILQSEDARGTFQFRVQRNCSQIQLEVHMEDFPDEVYIDVNKREIMAIIEMLNEAVK
ncbi:MAG: hypothetical protein LBQ28_04680 [Prevotellaceae bacterium]|jgi:hypothetical protein|nr:hypothetical protein [Prevotellaceae bacterium]